MLESTSLRIGTDGYATGKVGGGNEVEEEERQTYVRIEQDILRLHSPNCLFATFQLPIGTGPSPYISLAFAFSA